MDNKKIIKTGSTGKSKLLWLFPGTGKSTVSLDYLREFFRDIKYFFSELDAHTSQVGRVQCTRPTDQVWASNSEEK